MSSLKLHEEFLNKIKNEEKKKIKMSKYLENSLIISLHHF